MSLRLYGNKYFGFIPQEVGQLKSHVFISLYKNKLTGSIPTFIGNVYKIITKTLISLESLLTMWEQTRSVTCIALELWHWKWLWGKIQGISSHLCHHHHQIIKLCSRMYWTMPLTYNSSSRRENCLHCEASIFIPATKSTGSATSIWETIYYGIIPFSKQQI